MRIEINTNLPQGWSSNILKEVIQKLTDGSHNPPKKQTHGLPMLSARNIENGYINFHEYRYINPNDFETEDKRTQIKPGDVLLTIVGAIGRATVVPENIQPFTVQRSVAVLSSSAFTPKFLMYQFRSPKIQRELLSKAKGTAQKGIYLKKLSGVKMLIPPLNEQKRIVAKIEALQTRSTAVKEELEAIKPLLNQFRQSVLAAAFRGDLTKDWREQNPDVEPTKVLLERIQVERRRRWEEAELEKMKARGKVPKDDKWKKKYKEPQPIDTEGLSELPDGWCWMSLGNVAWSVKDGPHYSPKYSESGIPFISGGNIRPEGIDFKNVKYISSELHEELSKRCVPEKGDILYTKGGTTGIARVNTYDRPFNVWVHVAVLKCVLSIEHFYLQHALNSPHCYQQSQKFTHGVGNQDLGLTRMVNITIPLAPFKEQKEIVRRIESLFKLAVSIQNQQSKIQNQIETLNQSILAKAFRGELVPQDPNDEPASVLLERIKEEREKAQPKKSKSKKKLKVTKAKQLGLDL